MPRGSTPFGAESARASERSWNWSHPLAVSATAEKRRQAGEFASVLKPEPRQLYACDSGPSFFKAKPRLRVIRSRDRRSSRRAQSRRCDTRHRVGRGRGRSRTRRGKPARRTALRRRREYRRRRRRRWRCHRRRWTRGGTIASPRALKTLQRRRRQPLPLKGRHRTRRTSSAPCCARWRMRVENDPGRSIAAFSSSSTSRSAGSSAIRVSRA